MSPSSRGIINVFINIWRKTRRANGKENQILRTDIGNVLAAHWRDKHNVTGGYFLRRQFSNFHKPPPTDNNVPFEDSFEAMPAGCNSGLYSRPDD
jgi:hypothetical protein